MTVVEGSLPVAIASINAQPVTALYHAGIVVAASVHLCTKMLICHGATVLHNKSHVVLANELTLYTSDSSHSFRYAYTQSIYSSSIKNVSSYVNCLARHIQGSLHPYMPRLYSH